jgi:hypothetical protein
MISGVNNLSNVIFLKRNNCHWGDFGHVLATLKGLQNSLQNDLSYDYVFLITGQNYPIKSTHYIQSFLKEANGKEFLSHYDIPNQHWGEDVLPRRTELWHFRFLEDWPFRCLDPFVHLPSKRKPKSKIKSAILASANLMFRKRTPPGNIKFFGGPGYWSITRRCAEYINAFATEKP